MSTVTLEEAGKRLLEEILETLPQQKEIVITCAGKPVATLKATEAPADVQGGHSLADIKPVSLGGWLRPYPHPDDDILGEMLDNKLGKPKHE